MLRPLLAALLLASAASADRGAFEELLEQAGDQPATRAVPAQGKPKPQDPPRESFKIGDAEVKISRQTRAGKAKGVVFFNMHENEKTSAQAGREVWTEVGGTLLELKYKGEREITFTSDGQLYIFDPNRIFTVAGAKKTLSRAARRKGGGYDRVSGKVDGKLVAKVVELGNELIEHLADASAVIALHNNTDGRYSIADYQKGGSEAGNSKAIHVDPKLDPDDFLIVTRQEHYDALAKHYNVTLQSDSPGDNGSLSVYCGSKVPYVNSEVEGYRPGDREGNQQMQVRMLRKVVDALAKK